MQTITFGFREKEITINFNTEKTGTVTVVKTLETVTNNFEIVVGIYGNAVVVFDRNRYFTHGISETLTRKIKQTILEAGAK